MAEYWKRRIFYTKGLEEKGYTVVEPEAEETVGWIATMVVDAVVFVKDWWEDPRICELHNTCVKMKKRILYAKIVDVDRQLAGKVILEEKVE